MTNLNVSPRLPAAVSWGRLLVVLLALTLSLAGKTTSFSTMIVFGDSLSDTGRLYALTDGGFPMERAYWNGRQSNGPVWVEYLANRLLLQTKPQNYAVIGALTAPTAWEPTGNRWSDTFPGLEGTSLVHQVAQYLEEHGGVADPAAVYVLQGGGNDLIAPLMAMMINPPTYDEFMAAVQELATATVGNLVGAVMNLRMHGAQHVAVMGLPDFSLTPRFAALGPTVQMIVGAVVQAVNGGLNSALDYVDFISSTTTLRIDAAELINDVAGDPTSFGFWDATTDFTTWDPVKNRMEFDAPRGHARYWFFWDDVHPTTTGHQVFSEYAFAVLQEAWDLPSLNRGRQ
jgi:phospholipase/lecithinase/hemolysin